MRRMLFVLAAVVVLSSVAVPSHAQLTYPENHYLVYNIADQLHFDADLQFRDQWMTWSDTVSMDLVKFANPLWEKNAEQVLFDPRVHHTWWKLDPIPAPIHTLLAVHQFGSYLLRTGNAIFLLNPSDKDDQIPPTEDWPRNANHYLCYEVLAGDPLQVPLAMYDQWGPHSNVAYEPYCFCNPVEKTELVNGSTYPIIDPAMHLTCYRLDPIPSGRGFTWDDQFDRGQTFAIDECLICFPSLKDDILPSEETNWGRINAMFGQEE